MLELAMRTKDGRFGYVNETRAEAKRLAWYGARGDGMASLARSLSIPVKLNEQELTIHFPEINSWIYLFGADDEKAFTRVLGTPFHRLEIDEAQRLQPKFTDTILSAVLPTLLDYEGELLLKGTAERKMSGLFYDVTRPEVDKRLPGWEVHMWTLLDNPYWGRADGDMVVWGANDAVVSGPHEADELEDAVLAARQRTGVTGLQDLLGGPEVAPLDSPIMRRQAGGQWTREDSNFVYAVNQLTDAELFYADARYRPDGFVDVPAALEDLPGSWREYLFSMGCDLGYMDPFTLTVWAWHPNDPNLYEVVSWAKSGLDSDDQNAVMKAIREHVVIGHIVADAGGIGKQVTRGWSKEWIERYNLPILEADKQHKATHISSFNTDILKRRVKFRRGGMLIEEMRELQWSSVVSGSGSMVEDPTMPNDRCDSALYGHFHSYQFRWRPEEKKAAPGTPERIAREVEEIEDDMMEMAG